MGLLLSSGCIVPQDDTVLYPLPPKKNRPPRIIPQLTNPAFPQTEIGLDPSCPPYTFDVAVEDPDVDDILRWAFFVDYDVNQKKELDGFIIPNGQVQRSDRVRAVFNPAGATSRLFTSGDHLLEVVVADTDFGSNREFAPHGQTSDGGPDPGYSDTFSWHVTAVPGSCP